MPDTEELIPRMRQGIDLTKAGLSVEEGFIASRVDGNTSVKDIATLVGKSAKETQRILTRLSKAGILVLGKRDDTADIPKVKSEEQPVEDGDYGSFIFPAHLMMEAGALSADQRKRVIYFHTHLDKWTYYEILKANRKDDAKAIKKSYFLRSKEWHPDRFPRKDLGSFKRLIEEIFKKVQDAYHALSDEELRKKYDEENVLMLDEDAIGDMLRRQRREERDKRRAEDRVKRRKKNNPVRQRLTKAKKFYEQAQSLKADGKLMDALRAVQTAVAFDPRDEYKVLEESLKAEAGEHRISPFMRRGSHEENMTNWDGAIALFSEAVRLAPEHGEARLRLAYNMLMGGRDPHEANTHAAKAVALLGADPEAHFVLGMCYEKGGMEKAAIREYKSAIDLKPNYTDAKKRLKKLKWGF